MTVVAALDAGECLLLAADSLVTEESGVRTIRQKLDILPGRSLAWGFSGDESIGHQFRDWLMAWSWPSDATWRGFADVAVEELSRLNGRQRHLNKVAGVETRDDDLASVLIAGYISGAPDVFELTNRGSATSVRHCIMAAIGSGHPHVTIAHRTLRAVVTDLKPDERCLRAIMHVAATSAPMCGLPVRVLRIDPTGVVELPTQGPS